MGWNVNMSRWSLQTLRNLWSSKLFPDMNSGKTGLYIVLRPKPCMPLMPKALKLIVFSWNLCLSSTVYCTFFHFCLCHVLETSSVRPLTCCEFSGHYPAVFSNRLTLKQTSHMQPLRKIARRCWEQLTLDICVLVHSPSRKTQDNVWSSVHVWKQL